MSGDIGLIPPATLRALNDHASGRLPFDAQGSFVQAVLSNNLKGAFLTGDRENLRALQATVGFCFNHLPAQSWGSPENAAAWRGVEQGQTELLPVTPPVRRDTLREG